MFHSINSTVAFTALSQGEQAVIWASFFDALDEGLAGRHPLYTVLAPLYAAGEYITDAEVLADHNDNLVLGSEILTDFDQLALAAELGDPPY
jgi:hypothetical protein